jgi:HEAT repeat protein
MAAKDFDAELEAVHAAGALPPEEALPHLRKFLAHRSNLIVSRAARHIARLELKALVPDLAAAFERFMQDPVKTDPQCWAKNDIAKALAAFEYQDHALFLSGMKHHQFEPVWGGTSDTAGPLRSTCALALVQCRELSSPFLLRLLTPLFTDEDAPVRVDAARAIEEVGSDTAALLLRLRAELGSPDPDDRELLGTCIGGVLRLDGESALPWVAAFLAGADDIAAEAAFVLAEHRTVSALAFLTQQQSQTQDLDQRATLLSAIATMRIPEATDWLFTLMSSKSLDSNAAAKALLEANPSEETLQRLHALGFTQS